jgi:uncharacterized protein (TIGR02300 family)
MRFFGSAGPRRPDKRGFRPVASVSASVPDFAARGLKRVCAGCGTRFYDLNKRPVLCPNCKVEFSSDVKGRVRRSRLVPDAVVPEAKPAPEEEVEIVAREDDLVSLEDVEESTDDEDLDEAEGDLELDEDIEEEIDVDIEEDK